MTKSEKQSKERINIIEKYGEAPVYRPKIEF